MVGTNFFRWVPTYPNSSPTIYRSIFDLKMVGTNFFRWVPTYPISSLTSYVSISDHVQVSLWRFSNFHLASRSFDFSFTSSQATFLGKIKKTRFLGSWAVSEALEPRNEKYSFLHFLNLSSTSSPPLTYFHLFFSFFFFHENIKYESVRTQYVLHRYVHTHTYCCGSTSRFFHNISHKTFHFFCFQHETIRHNSWWVHFITGL